MPPKTKGLGSKKGTSKGVTSKEGTSKEGTSKTSSSSFQRVQKRYAVSDSSNGSESESGNDPTPSQEMGQNLEMGQNQDLEPQPSAQETEEEEPQPAAPKDEDFFLEPTEYKKQCKIQTRCELSNFLEIIKEFPPELEWFESHPQFQHIFHMVQEPNHMLRGLWILLLRTVKVERRNAVWFVVNGVPIRYSLREHGLLCGFDCHEYPPGYNPRRKLKNYESELRKKVFGANPKTKVTIKDVKEKLLSRKKSSETRLKLAILYFLSAVLACKSKSDGNIEPFLFKMAEDPEMCKSFPWGRMTFEGSVRDIYHAVESMNGSAKEKMTFPGFVIPLEILAFECITNLKTKFRASVEEVNGECPIMCNKRFQTCSMKGWTLEEVYETLGDSKDIQSVLEPEYEEEEELLSRILEAEETYAGYDPMQDHWSDYLVVKKKKICWQGLYDSDVASRVPIEEEEEDIGLGTEAGGKEDFEVAKNPALVQLLKELEDRLVERMREGFEKVNDAHLDLEKKVMRLKEKVKAIRSEVRGHGYSWDGFERADNEYVGEPSGTANAEKGKEKGTEMDIDKEKEPSGTADAGTANAEDPQRIKGTEMDIDENKEQEEETEKKEEEHKEEEPEEEEEKEEEKERR